MGGAGGRLLRALQHGEMFRFYKKPLENFKLGSGISGFHFKKMLLAVASRSSNLLLSNKVPPNQELLNCHFILLTVLWVRNLGRLDGSSGLPVVGVGARFFISHLVPWWPFPLLQGGSHPPGHPYVT